MRGSGLIRVPFEKITGSVVLPDRPRGRLFNFRISPFTALKDSGRISKKDFPDPEERIFRMRPLPGAPALTTFTPRTKTSWETLKEITWPLVTGSSEEI